MKLLHVSFIHQTRGRFIIQWLQLFWYFDSPGWFSCMVSYSNAESIWYQTMQQKNIEVFIQIFFQDKKIITIYKRNEPHININNKLCGSIWKSSRPGLCELFRNQHKHLSNIWFWEMKLQNKQNFYKCVCRRNVCPVLLCWGLMWSHPPAAVNSWSKKYPS